MLPKAAVVCALLALFSAGSQGNKEYNVNKQYLAAWNEQFDGQRGVFRRESETCLPYSDEHSRRLDLVVCDEEYIRAVFSEIETSNCRNDLYNDTIMFSECGTNHNGDMCGSIEYSIYDDFYECYEFYNYTNNCSSECQTALRQLSDSVGCCIHDNDEASMPSLWMDCNVEQPEVCADIPNAVDALAKRNVDPCTEKFSQRQGYFTLCKYLGEKYEKIDRECGVEDGIGVHLCGFDKGEFCITMDDPTSYFETISDECYSDSEEGNERDGVCSTNCRNVLKEFIDTVGCCVHYFNSPFYNSFEVGSTSTYYELTSDLFSACGIEVPDACSSFDFTAVPDDFLEHTINGEVNITTDVDSKVNITTDVDSKVNITTDVDSKVNTTINNNGAVLQSGVYSIGLIIIGLISIYI